MKKKIIFILFIFTHSLLNLAAQQITRVAVLDTDKVYKAYYSDSAKVRDYESKKTKYQEEINAYTEEIEKLNEQRAEYEAANDFMKKNEIERQIRQKTAFLREYTKMKNEELSKLKKGMKTTNDFYKKLYRTIEKVAERGGYSVILSLQNNSAILWHSSSVDITDEVIKSLGK